VLKRGQGNAARRYLTRHAVSARVSARRRMSPRSGLVLIGAAGICLVPPLTASADVESGTSAGAGAIHATTVHATTAQRSFPLSTRHLAVRMVGGRIVASATVVNTGSARVRSTIGVLGLISGSGGSATGVRTFAVPSLPAGRSSRVRLTTRPMRGLPVRSKTVKVVLCTDIGSQIRRFAPNSHCAHDGAFAITTAAVREASGPVPSTTVQTGPAAASSSSTAVFGFVSTVPGSVFQCSLDGGPWLACTSPQRYAGLVDGRHAFAVRAISPSGRQDPTPARVAWTVDTVAPKVTLRRPVNGSTTSDRTPAFSGTGGTAATDSSTITVKVYSGSGTSGSPVQTLTTTRSGQTWSVPAAQPLANGTYTAQAQQSDSAGNVGLSTLSTFTINVAPPPPSKYSIGGTVSGLSGTVVLQDNGGDDLNVGTNGSFTFATKIAAGGAYHVTVANNPTGEVCTVSGGSGTVASANVTSVSVTCAAPPPPPPPSKYSIGGTVSGLSGTVVLQDNGGDDLNVGTNGSFTFATKIAAGGAYHVTVANNPTGEVCTVSGGSGTVASANVTSVSVTCAASPPPPPPPGKYSVGGTVSGLSGTVVLQDNGGDDLNVSSNGSFTFATPVVDGGAYQVTVASNPTGQACTVAGGSGTVASANVTSVAVTCGPATTQIGQDDFNRADGGPGANWAAMTDGGLSIASQHVVGPATANYAGDIRVAASESYGSDQYSQIEVTADSIGPGVGGAGKWVGPTVRSQNGGQDTYLGIYFYNGGTPQLRLYVRTGSSFTQLGASYNCGVLPAGTQLTLTAVGSRISFAQNGIDRITVTSTTLTGGAPGIMTFDAGAADNWSAGDATAPPPQQLQIQFQGTDANGVSSYDVLSADDGNGSHVLRVLAPTNPAPGVPHNFLYVLPVEPELGTTYGDGLETLRQLNAQNQYNLTIIEPSFAIDPWYADNPNDPSVQYETFMTKDLVPWVTQHLAVTGHEQNWLIGFSKSGQGAQDLILKHPDLFAAAASWDFPADMATYDQFGSSSADEYGTQANFQANYRLTASFLDAHKAPFSSANRIWIGGYNTFQTDVADYDGLLTTEAIDHTTETPQLVPHRWDSGWVPTALSALSQDGVALPAAP
jgi:Bacterial Ig-like domain/Putative esterase